MLELPVILPEVLDCKLCNLYKERNQVVAGDGSLSSSLLIVGETADKENDIMGEPFTDLSKGLLNKYLEASGISKTKVYTTLTVKCYGEKVAKKNIDVCKVWLWKEIQNINPKVILTLGKIPTKLLLRLKSKFKMEDYAGKFHDLDYSPAKLASWYNLNWLLNRGKKFDKLSIEFFTKIREKISGP